MSHSNATCPQELMQMETSGVTYCQQTNIGCQGTTFSALGLSYTRVCGRLRGYQEGVTTAFAPYYHNSSLTLTDVYVVGVSIIYGTAMPKHIFGLMLQESHFEKCHVMNARAILEILFRLLLTLAVTTTVRLATIKDLQLEIS